MPAMPKIVSADDHVVEPANVWQDRLPAKYKEVGPRVARGRGVLTTTVNKVMARPRPAMCRYNSRQSPGSWQWAQACGTAWQSRATAF